MSLMSFTFPFGNVADEPIEHRAAEDSATFHINVFTEVRRSLLLQRTDFPVNSYNSLSMGNPDQNAVCGYCGVNVVVRSLATTQYASVIDMSSTNTNQLPSNSGMSSTNRSNNNNIVCSITRNVNNDNNVTMNVGYNLNIPYLAIMLLLIIRIAFNYVSAVLMFIEFFYFNKFVKHQVTLRSKRKIGSLVIGIFLISLILIDNYFSYISYYLYFGLIFIPPHSQPLSIMSMLWSTALGDYALKLTTILLKMIVAIMPIRVLPIMKRGKMYLFIEATSQLLRCSVPILAWPTYFLNDSELYQIFGIFLYYTYCMFKCFDILYRTKLWWRVSCNLFQNIGFKSVPCKEEITEAGLSCSICHDTFVSPVMLRCNHIFCEICITTWLDHDQTCPLCREKIVDNLTWCDGSTTHFVQFL